MIGGADAAPGQTPIDADEAIGLKPRHITTQAQLDQWEQVNITAGQRWALREFRRTEVLDEVFVRELHRRMFGDTWKWAGTYRRSDKNIGVAWEQVAVRTRQLLDNVRWQLSACATGEIDRVVIGFHRELVWIHPFPNGNGRHARMLADLLAMRLGAQRYTWGALAGERATQDVRGRYLAALRVGDQGDLAPLVAFARS